jgi:hypothetical protein
MSKTMRKAILFLTALGAALAQSPNVAGHYYLQNFREVGSEMMLKPDGSFEFMLAYGAADYWAKGTWRVRDGAVYLNSTPGEEKPPFKLLHSSATKTAAIRIRVMGANGKGVPNIDVILNTEKGKLEERTDSDGIALFPKNDPARNAVFRIRVYQLETQPLALNPAHDDFTFEIDGQAITELRFNDERMAIHGKTLTTFYWGPDREMNYVKGE